METGAESAHVQNGVLYLNNFSMQVVQGHLNMEGILKSIRGVLNLARQYGAKSINLNGSIASGTLARKLGIPLDSKFSITVDATVSGLLEALKKFK